MNSTAPIQISFAFAEYEGKKKLTRREIFHGKMEQVVPWPQLMEVIEPFYPKSGNSVPMVPSWLMDVRFSAHFGLWLLGLRIWRTDLKTVRSQFQGKDFFFRHVSISFKVELIVQHGPAQAIGKQFVFGHRSDTRAKTERTKKNSLETFDL